MPHPVELQLTQTLLEAAAEQMGVVLQRAAFSANIKERRDFSCALFDANGAMLAQAAHIPVHLGSMPASVAAVLEALPDLDGDAIVNDPYEGGSHLPDVTLVTPIDQEGKRIGYAASRAHFADIGGDFPGGMGLSTHIDQEGVRLPPMRLAEGMAKLQAGVGNPAEVLGDVESMTAANRVGGDALRQLVARPGFDATAAALREHARAFMWQTLSDLPPGRFTAHDVLDDDGAGTFDISITCFIDKEWDVVDVCVMPSPDQVKGCVNCPLAVTQSAIYYAFICLMRHKFPDAPINEGCFDDIDVLTRLGSVVNPEEPAAVCAGNTETSQRIVDVVFAALAKALPDFIPAASCGSMNSLALAGDGWSYYETVPGGSGASAERAGASAVQTHMTNTRNTPAEALELEYPLRVLRYELADNAPSADLPGGSGVVREIEVLEEARVTLLGERRRVSPPNGAAGENRHNGEVIKGKAAFKAKPGDRIKQTTPSGGGHSG
ncbi:MAG: hydantoinase B/oxoprolinase family protein [Planctomycetota bacterium]